MISHKLMINGEDLSPYLVSAEIEKRGDGQYYSGTCKLKIANIYGIFTGRWRDEGDETSKVTLSLRNERFTCVGDAILRIDEGGAGGEVITIEANAKTYSAFCGYIQKADYDEKYADLIVTTGDQFLEQEPMPDGVRPSGGTAYIATPPAEIILDVIKQHKDPAIAVATLTAAQAAAKGYPVLQTQRKNLPGYKQPIPPLNGGSGNGSGGPGSGSGSGSPGSGSGSPGSGSGSSQSQTCSNVCRYKRIDKCCKATECAYKKKNALCRQVKCPYDTEKRDICYASCPYDSGNCPDSVTSAQPYECPTCNGTGSMTSGGICGTCGGLGTSNNQGINAAIASAQDALAHAAEAVNKAQQEFQQAETPAAKQAAAIKLENALQVQQTAQADLNRLSKFQEKPTADETAGTDPEEMVYIDFWNPQIIKDQVAGPKGVKYADIIRAVVKATGGIFYVDENCKAKFLPPDITISRDSPLDITHLVTKQGLGKNAMGHANIVVVYGSGITEPGISPVERERHKVIGYLQENVDSVHRHGTIQAAEVDVHYLPKQSQVEELAGNLLEYYKGEDDKATVEAIGICPPIFQKVKWKVPIGPVMDLENCRFGSTAIMATITGRIVYERVDYSAKGWTVELQVSTSEDPVSTSVKNPVKTFVAPPAPGEMPSQE